MYYAKKIQRRYTSWEEYGFDYLLGRLFWASGFADDYDCLLITDRVYRILIGPGGYWRSLRWDEPLGADPGPAPPLRSLLSYSDCPASSPHDSVARQVNDYHEASFLQH